MTKFNPENKELLTYGECLHPAMKITEQADADQYFAAYVSYIQKYLDENPREDTFSAKDIACMNLGYFAGYYNNETRERVERLFNCSHPIFGRITENGAPAPEQAVKRGLTLGQVKK